MLYYIYPTDCGTMNVEDVTSKEFDVVWNCPCSNWPSVDKYELTVVASDGDMDYFHTIRNVEGIQY